MTNATDVAPAAYAAAPSNRPTIVCAEERTEVSFLLSELEAYLAGVPAKALRVYGNGFC